MKALKNFFKLGALKETQNWSRARDEYGHKYLPFILFLQCLLVPAHIFTTDFLDESTRLSMLSITFRLGAVAIFWLTFLVVKRFKLHIDVYYSFTFLVNAMSDAYVSTYSSPENIVTHMLGFGLVLIAYALLMIIPSLVYITVMLVSTILLFLLSYYLSDVPFDMVLSQGGAFIIFLVFICPLVNFFRYESLRNEFLRTVELYKLNNTIEDANTTLLEKNEELNQQQEEILAQRDALSEANSELAEKNQDIIDSMSYASRIQSSILPTPASLQAAYADHFVLYRPKDIVSGDTYWFVQTPELSMLAVVDCTGHGTPGALMTMIAITSLNKLFHEMGITRPDEMLAALNNEVIQTLDQMQNQNMDGMDISLCTFRKKDRVVECAAANSTVCYVQNGEMVQLRGDRVPIGGYQHGTDRAYTLHTVTLDAPTPFYLFTDGYVDQFGGAQKRKLGKAHLLEMLIHAQDKPMAEQKAALETYLLNWMAEGGTEQIDDVTVAGVVLG